MKKEKIGDVSKTTITTLLIVSILVSIIGTWTVLTTMDNIIKDSESRPMPASSSGKVAVTIDQRAQYGGDVKVTLLPNQ